MNSKQFDQTKDFWNEEVKRGALVYPAEHVIRFVKHNYKVPDDTTILDYGCGAGRDTLALLSEGYHVISLDYSDNAIQMLKDRCKARGLLNSQIIQRASKEIEMKTASVDAVIADGSLFYAEKEEIISNLKEIVRVMKDGGLIWADFRTVEDSLFGRGKKIAEGLFELTKDTGREGCLYYFATEKDIYEIFEGAGLQVVSIDDFVFTERNRECINKWFHVVAKK